MIGGKVAVVCGFGEVGKRQLPIAARSRLPSNRDRDRSNLRSASCDGCYEVKTLEDVIGEADIFITTTGNKDIITVEHMKQMKDKAIIGNIGSLRQRS